MDVSMESIDTSPESDTEAHDRLFDAQQSHPQNASDLMPPPSGPPSAIPFHLAQSLAGFSFISPSKEGEVPMEFSPGVKRHIEKGNVRDSPKAQGSMKTRRRSMSNRSSPECERSFKTKASPDCETPVSSKTKECESLDLVNSKGSPEYEIAGGAKGGEMHPADIFASRPGSPSSGSPSSEFKAMLDAIDVNESPSGTSDNDFLKRKEKPNIRRCRSLEMRKKLFDMSNTRPSEAKTVFKRPAEVGSEDQNCPKIAKRPKELSLSSIKESSMSSLTEERSELKEVQASLNSSDSLEHERIKSAVDVLQSPEMIGDCSREHCLPVIVGKHSDLKSINHETMASLITGGFKGKFDKLTIIDARYPYEFDGGHIMGAVNLYTEDDIDAFLKKEMLETMGGKFHTHILVFHCEFSSQRGPGLLRQLRKLDRNLNLHHYPQLTFPEMYVLHLGYKEFFHNHPHLCSPSAYVPMADESYITDLKHFRAKAKSWAAGERTRSSKR